MSRRKQLKPKQFQWNDSPPHGADDASPGPAPPPPPPPPPDARSAEVCDRCCAEFGSLSDLERHQRRCSPNLPVLVVNENEEAGESVCTSDGSDSEVTGCPDSKTDAALFAAASPRDSSSAGHSWIKSDVIIENLESTKMAVAHFARSSSASESGVYSQSVVSSLLQQLLALQIQQIHQLQLIDQIHQQLLLFAPHTPEAPATGSGDPSSLKSTDQLKVLGSHLSQQLAAAAGLARCLSAQSANMDAADVHKQPRGSSNTQLNLVSQTKMSSLTLSNDRFFGKNPESSHLRHLPSPPSDLATSNLVSNVSVEDLDALAALTKQRALTNLRLSDTKLFSKQAFFRHQCRFCSKALGSDSALQIHLRSHTGEKPYECNICGNRFSTRGNLKVHLQRHKQRYLVDLDSVPDHPDHAYGTNGASCRANRTPSPVAAPTEKSDSSIEEGEKVVSLPISLKPGGLCLGLSGSIDSKATTNSDSARANASLDVKPSFNFKLMNIKSEVNERSLTHPVYTSLSRFFSMECSEGPELRTLSENTHKRLSLLHECSICHRVLSCRGALRMHYQTHAGGRRYPSQACSRTFTTKGTLQTHHHQGAAAPLRVRKFANAAILQRHELEEGHLPTADHPDQIHKMPRVNSWGFCDDGLPRFKSLSVHLAPSFDRGVHQGALQWMKTNEDQLSKQSGEGCQWSDAPPRQPLSHNGKASVYLQTAHLDRRLNATTFMLCASATTPADQQKSPNAADSLSFSHWQKGLLRSTYCDICGKNFNCQSALDIHYRSHTKERPFMCSTCNKGFSTKGNLKQHMLTHQMRDFPSRLLDPSNPNRAADQSRTYSGISRVVKTEAAAYPRPSVRRCRDVRGGFYPATMPRRTPKQHHCKTCGKSFSSSSALQIHERTHTGERPFVCTVCGRAFTTKGNLKVHMGTHMWSSAPSRRGRRLLVERSTMGFGTHPVKLPEPPRSNSGSRDAASHWKQSPQTFPTSVKPTDFCAVQSGGVSPPPRHKDVEDKAKKAPLTE